MGHTHESKYRNHPPHRNSSLQYDFCALQSKLFYLLLLPAFSLLLRRQHRHLLLYNRTYLILHLFNYTLFPNISQFIFFLRHSKCIFVHNLIPISPFFWYHSHDFLNKTTPFVHILFTKFSQSNHTGVTIFLYTLVKLMNE